MKLSDNPFYILQLPCTSGRRDIVSASEELSIILDSEACSNAQNDLINLGKRLNAEICWFLELDKDNVKKFVELINSDEELSTDGLLQPSRLNATLHNFSISKENDPFEMGYAVLDIDEQYSQLDVDEITATINKCREIAKISLVQNKVVAEEINKKRDDIRQIISERLSPLEQESYIELVTMLAEKCIADDDYEDGVILADVVDQYEVRMQSQLEESTEAITSHINRIQQIINDDAISENIQSLIRRVKKWDILAQPLQLKSQASGMPHEISENLGRQLRNLALFLHNEKGKTEEALTLVDAMKGVFAELGGLADLFDSDSDALNELIQGEEEAKEILAEMDAIKKLGESLKAYPTTSSIDSYVNRVKKLDARLKTIDLDPETRKKIRESLCYMARAIAIDLHNTNHRTNEALTIAKALSIEFGDIPELRSKLILDVATLNQQCILSLGRNTPSRPSYYPQSRSSSKSSNLGCLIPIVIFVIIIIIAAIAGGGGSSSSKSSTNTSKPSSSYSLNSGGYSGSNKSNGSNNNGNSGNKSTTSVPVSNTITLSKSNFETYFNLTTDAEFIDDQVTITYSISPKNSSYSKDSDSSETINVEIGAVVSMLQYYYGEPEYNKKHSVTLYKSNNYTTSGTFSLTYSSFADTVYWQADVTSCTGKIGK